MTTSEKYDPYEVLRDVAAMMNGLDGNEQRQVMAALAEKFGMKLLDKPANGGSRPRPGFRRKRPYS